MTTVNDFVDILRIIREQPEWGDALRSALLSRELLGMPQRLAELTATVGEFAASTEKRLVALETDVARLKDDVAELRGDSYEQKVANNIATLVRHPLIIRRVRVLKGYGAADSMTFHEVMDSAEDRGDISRQERTEAGRTDIVLSGQRGPDRSNVYVAVEVSVTAGDNDISRAADRSELLSRATGEDSLSAVVSVHIDPDRQKLARERNVILIAYND